MSARERWEAERASHRDTEMLVISTHVPSKWLAVDRETGDQWEWVDGRWKRAAHEEMFDPPEFLEMARAYIQRLTEERDDLKRRLGEA